MPMRLIPAFPAAAVMLLAALAPASSAAGEVADADAARKKPLQRCDQMSDKAEIACLQKARERIVEARQKRENAGQANSKAPNAPPPGATKAESAAPKAPSPAQK